MLNFEYATEDGILDDAVGSYLENKRITVRLSPSNFVFFSRLAFLTACFFLLPIQENDVLKNGSNSLTQTPVKMLESSVLEYHTSQNNTYIYSCSIQSISQMDAEFVRYTSYTVDSFPRLGSGYTIPLLYYYRLKNWIHEMDNAKFKLELSPMLFPIFCHLYLDAISDGNCQLAQAAVVFFKRHQPLFTSESLRDIIKDVGSILKKEEIDSKPLVKAFRYYFTSFRNVALVRTVSILISRCFF